MVGKADVGLDDTPHHRFAHAIGGQRITQRSERGHRVHDALVVDRPRSLSGNHRVFIGKKIREQRAVETTQREHPAKARGRAAALHFRSDLFRITDQ